jgi:hypothetical protein
MVATTSPAAAESGEWGRWRLLAVLTVGVATAVLLVAGLVLAIRSMFATSDRTAASIATATSPASPAAPLDQAARRDAIAAAPMLAVSAEDARPTTPAAVPAPSIEIPPATTPGPADVPTGFPHTPEGALGQLAAIDVTVLQGMSIAATNHVYAAWVLPGGVGVTEWAMTKNVQAFLGAAGMGANKSATAAVVVNPAAARVKGSDGPDWVLACVLLQVRASIRVEAQIGYGHCERMTWQRDRWLIAPGAAPATAPSTWPSTELAARAGWLTWVDRGAR